jgi:predicted DsbA family dithiol-disulfide isomerase
VTPLPVTIFADFSCPYSYLAEAVLWRMLGPDVALIPRAFELYPDPAPLEPPRFPAAEWENLDILAAGADVPLRPADFRPRTRKAHETSRFAREQGREIALRAEIFAAYWTEGRDIGRIDVLVDLAGRVGLDAGELRIALDIDQYEEAVRNDQEVSRRLRVPGTPTIFIGSGIAAQVLVGAQSPNDLKRLVDEATHKRAERSDDG